MKGIRRIRQKIPEGRLGDLIGPSQIQWVIDQYGDPPAHTGVVAVGTKKAAKDLLRKSPELQCRALENTYQEESSDEGKWEYKDSSCRKQRKLSWLEKTLWNMYQVQSDSTIEWLSTSRNTLVAADDTVNVAGERHAELRFMVRTGEPVPAHRAGRARRSRRDQPDRAERAHRVEHRPGRRGPSARPHRLDTARRAARLLVREHRAHVLLPLVRRQSGPAVMDAGRRHHVLPVGLHPYAG